MGAHASAYQRPPRARPEPQALVRAFHAAFGVPARDRPTANIPAIEAQLRLDLLTEEVDELRVAIAEHDILEIADALGDLAYVLYGTALSFGIELQPVIEEIHASNMSKLDDAGRPVLRPDGKVLKGPAYRPPNLERVLGL